VDPGRSGTNERADALWGYDCDVPKNIRKQLHVVWLLRKESWTGQLEYMSANGRSSNIKKVWSVLKVVNATHLCENPLLPLFQTIASVGTNCTRYSWYAHRYPVNLHANWLPWHMELLDSAWTAVRFLPVTQAVFNDPQNSQLLRWVTVGCGPPPMTSIAMKAPSFRFLMAFAVQIGKSIVTESSCHPKLSRIRRIRVN
jgi:hypothetical protein